MPEVSSATEGLLPELERLWRVRAEEQLHPVPD
jgi:hypothetical protein